MRIISGELGGRKITPPATMPHTRPTTDLAKEGLFNIVSHRLQLEGIRTLDLFGGTGCISYELASRGAADLTIVEKDPTMYDFIKGNVAKFNISNCKILRLDVFSYLQNCSETFDFIFAGPPYSLGTIDELPKIIVQKNLIAADGYFVLEHTPRNAYEKFPGYSFHRNYGTTVFTFFEKVMK